MNNIKVFKNTFVGLLALIALLGFTTSCERGADTIKISVKEYVELAVKDYLDKNPQLLQKGAAPAARPVAGGGTIEGDINRAIKVDLNNAPFKGPKDAKITIVAFSDFQCPFCNRVNPTMDQLMKDYEGKLRIAFRQHPLSFHQNAMSAAKASLAANEQGKFWEMHDAMFADQRNLTEDNIRAIAQKIGLNMAKFEKDWKSDKFAKQIQDDVNFAQANGATGTPAFFINGVYVKGAKPLPYFKNIIDQLLAKK